MVESNKKVVILRRCVRGAAAALLILIGAGAVAAYTQPSDSVVRPIIPQGRDLLNIQASHDEPTHEPANASSRDSRRIIWMRVTAYCANKKCCGPHACGITASGKPVSFNEGRFVAADTSVLPFGTKVSIPGYHGGQSVPVIDRGGAIKGDRLDVFFPSYETALQWGVKWLPVTIEN
ncbi:MAG TPA: 3D domain-containing protein [Tepidisphaeraceae bacterium]|nr:3D domain-containing protein [Tepidisphaeraceae bacterium]